MNLLQLAQLQSQINTLLLASMNHAIKLNSIADSIWPDYRPNDQSPPPRRDLNVIQEFLSGFSLNELHQVMGLCNHKALFLVLEKADFIIRRFSENLPQLLRQMDTFFQTWIHPAFQFNLKRPFDTNVLQYHIQGSIQKLMGKILKQISKVIAQSQWDLISGFLINLGYKSKYYQILIISGYFEEIQTMETQFQEFEIFKEIFKNFEYEIVTKVITVVIGNVSLCKEDLQLLEIEALQNSLSLMNETEGMKQCISVGRNSQFNISRLKYLRNNFQVLRKIINFNFNYDIYFFNEEVGQSYIKFPPKKQKRQKKQKKQKRCVSFPNYIVKPFLQENFLTKLYQIAQLLISLELEGNKVRMKFADIILKLIGKIIKTRVAGFNAGLKEKFMKEMLLGHTRLMMAYSGSFRAHNNLVLKILKGNIMLLKNTTVLDLLTLRQSQLWFIQAFKLIYQLISRQNILTEDSYLFCKALCLTRQLVSQAAVHQLNSTNELFTRDVVSFGLKVLQVFMHKFVGESQGNFNVGKYYSLEDLISKRDRYFHNVKILCQIYLSSFNQLLKSILIKINSVPQALNYLIFVSYILNTDLLNPTSFYYACQQDDILTFKKITIGNTLILSTQLMRNISTPELLNSKSQDVVFLMIQKLLQLVFENHTDISLNMISTDIYLKTETNCCIELSSTPRVLKMLFGWIFKIIQVKTEKHNDFQQQIEPYFHILVKYLKLLMNEDYQLESFQLISIQCELTQEFIEFKHRFRGYACYQERRNLSQITILLHQEPQSKETKQDNDKRKHLLFQSQVNELLKILQSNPNDWIGICYQIGGFLQCISKEQTYVTVISLLGKEFLEKLSLSCLNHSNLHSIKLLTYFNDSFLDFTEDHKIKNLKFWLPFLKNILSSWILCLKLICSQQSNEQNWEQLCYEPLINLLTNDNLNFYLLKRSTEIKEVLTNFTTGLMDFLNYFLLQKCKSSQLQNTNLFRFLKIVFKYFSEFYILNERQQNSKEFFLLINRLISLVNNHLKMINNRKIHCVGLLIDELKPLNTILQFFSSVLLRYRYKGALISKVEQFVREGKQDLLLLQSELYNFRVNYEKHLKFQEEKYRQSQVNLLNSISQLICSLCNKQKSQKNNDQSTMSVSDAENALEKERDQEQMRQEEMQKQMEEISLLEKQLVWFDIEGNRTITEY